MDTMYGPKHSPLKAEDMDVKGKLFALRLVPGGSNGLVELFVEDDENYHFKFSFDRSWLLDLVMIADAGARKTP